MKIHRILLLNYLLSTSPDTERPHFVSSLFINNKFINHLFREVKVVFLSSPTPAYKLYLSPTINQEVNICRG